MAQYVYKCKEGCDHEFETNHSIHVSLEEAYPDYRCPSCGAGPEVQERLIMPVATIFKGSGWAADGYSKAKEGNSLPKLGGKG